MSEQTRFQPDSTQPPIYQIRLAGRLSRRREAWFDGMIIDHDEAGQTVITGPVVDQAALHGLLRKVRDLGVPLLSVNRIDPGTRADQESLL
jgi:hypothetical protein